MVIFSCAAFDISPLARMSRAVSNSSLVSRLAFVFDVFFLGAISHLDQTSISESPFDLLVAGAQEYAGDLSQGFQFGIFDIFTLVLGKAEQEHGPARTKSDKQAEAAPLTLSWPCDTLLDDLTSKIGVDEASLRPFDGGDQTCVGDAVLTGEPRKRFRLEKIRMRFPVPQIIVYSVTNTGSQGTA